MNPIRPNSSQNPTTKIDPIDTLSNQMDKILNLAKGSMYQYPNENVSSRYLTPQITQYIQKK